MYFFVVLNAEDFPTHITDRLHRREHLRLIADSIRVRDQGLVRLQYSLGWKLAIPPESFATIVH